MDNNKADVFKENEIQANKVISVALIVSGAVFLAVWILFETGLYYMESGVPRLFILSNIVLMLFTVVISFRYKHEKRWLKYLIMAVVIITYAMMDGIFTYNAVIFILVPIVLSCRYFSKRYTVIVAICTYVAFFLSAVWGANNGLMDLNSLELPKGTIINLGEETWLSDAVVAIAYDKSLMIRNVLFYSYGVKLLLSLIVTVASIMIASQGRLMVLRQKNLTEEAARISQELALATKTQADMLPEIAPPFSDNSLFDLYASMSPAKEVGGDLYDFFFVDEDHLALVIADVSGKGVPAALFMMAAKIQLGIRTMVGGSPGEILTDVNKQLCKNNKSRMFVTVWLGILDLHSGILKASNAGHERPAIRKKDGIFKIFKDKHGLVLGSLEASKYKDYEIQLEPGDTIFVYTDGIPEAARRDKEFFGKARMVETLNSIYDVSPQTIIQTVKSSVDSFVNGAEQFDDITMLALKLKATKQNAAKQEEMPNENND